MQGKQLIAKMHHTIIIQYGLQAPQLKIIYLISRPKHMLWVRKKNVSMRRFFLAPQVGACSWKLFILYLNQNIYCGYSKEQSQWDCSFENHWYERVTENYLSSLPIKPYVVGSQYSLLILFQSRLNETVLLSNQNTLLQAPR